MLVRARSIALSRQRQSEYTESVLLRHGRHLGGFAAVSGSCVDLDDHLACLRRRSYAGKPSTPQYSSTAAAFKQRFVDIQVIKCQCKCHCQWWTYIAQNNKASLLR